MSTPPDSSPFARLAREHDVMHKHLAELSRLAAGNPTDQGRTAALRNEVSYFEQEFARHMRLEDRVLLPALETLIGTWCLLPGWMLREHEHIRERLKDVRREVEHAAADPVAAAAALKAAVGNLEALLAIHVHREDQLLMPVARAVLRPDQWAVLERAIG